MKFSEQWLRGWVNPAVPTPVLGDQLTMAGLEVESVGPAASDFKGVVAGKILNVKDHPQADRLKDCTVDTGASHPLRIITGAQVVPEMIVAVAPEGAQIAGNKIKDASFKGVTSQGMLCSAAELGLSEDKEALLILPRDTAPGTDLRALLDLDDNIIEIAITPNRGDCLSIAGVARELAAINDMTVTEVTIPAVAAAVDDSVSVRLLAPEACPRYVGRVIKNINPAAETPPWLRERLRRGGIRAISPVVDVTNYILLELGQPMHAFDMNKVDGDIQVRIGEPDEQVTLLDGQTLTLRDHDTLVIADRGGVIALAGIMGGQGTAVDGTTASLFLESAHFTPAAIAGRPRRFGLQTDSSYRFERGVDPQLPVKAMERATGLIIDICGGKPGPLTEAISQPHLRRPEAIPLRDAYLQRILGIPLEEKVVTQYLSRLGMKSVREAAGWQVVPPGHRFDLSIEADLVEEVARLYGYGRLPLSVPRQPLTIKSRHAGPRTQRVRTLLADRGYQEVITYSFIDPAMQSLFDPHAVSPRLKNPISEDMAVMRSSLWPSLVQAVQYNAKRQQARVRVFEIAPRYRGHGRDLEEETVVAGAAFGPVLPEQWGSPGQGNDFFDSKGDVEAVLALYGPPVAFEFKARPHPVLHPGQSAGIFLRSSGEQVGWLGTLHPVAQRRLGLSGPAPVLFELSLQPLERPAHTAFSELSKFPSVRRDIAVVVDQEVPAQAMLDAVHNAAGGLLQEVQLFDVYQGKHLELGRKSVALGLTLQDFSRTLTDQEVEEVVSAVLDKLNKDFGATLRE